MILELNALLDIVLSVLLGFIIGLERKMRSKDAGIRTHVIVCMGSALMMVVSKYAFLDMPDYDPARIAAQIVSGIGFLGAGIIVYRKNAIHGLTTAAGVWATAGVGMACGGQLYILAVGATAIMVISQCVLHIKCRLFMTKWTYRLNIRFVHRTDEANQIKEIFGVHHFQRFRTERNGDHLLCEVTLSTEIEKSSEKLNEIMREHDFIREIQRVDED